MIKKLLFVIALILLGVLSYVTNKFIPVQGIIYVYLVPTILFISMLHNTRKPGITDIIFTTTGGILYILGANFFQFGPTMNEGVWCLVGGVISYLLILLYKYAKKEGAKEAQKETTEPNIKENEKNN